MKTVQPFLTIDIVKRCDAHKEELETLNRKYCCSPGCSKFIPPASIKNGRATCKNYAMVTCTICKSPSDHGDCPKDTALHGLQTAVKYGWQKCLFFFFSVSGMMLIVAGKDVPAASSSAINAAENGEAVSAFDGTSTLYYTQLAALTTLQTNTMITTTMTVIDDED